MKRTSLLLRTRPTCHGRLMMHAFRIEHDAERITASSVMRPSSGANVSYTVLNAQKVWVAPQAAIHAATDKLSSEGSVPRSTDALEAIRLELRKFQGLTRNWRLARKAEGLERVI